MAMARRARRRRIARTLDHLSPPRAHAAAARDEGDAERAEIRKYMAEGAARARQLGNRGPLRIGADGRLAPDILAAYYEHGF
jgi:hypothetical protein